MPRALISSCKRLREGGAGDERLLDAGRVAAGLLGGVEQDLEEVRRAAIGGGAEGRDHLELLLGVARSGRDDDAAERAGSRIHDEAARHEMIAEGVQHHVALAETHGMERARGAPGVQAGSLGLEDRARRGEKPPEGGGRHGHEAGEGRVGLLQRRQLRFAQNRQACKRRAAGDGARIDAAQPRRIGRRPQRSFQHIG